jgi:hypothetical protein
MSSGEHASLEPTADLHILPVDFGSSISGRVVVGPARGHSEISLPPQPELPSSAPKAPVSFVGPKAAPPTPEPARAPEPPAPPQSEPDIDPLASTGQAPIPSTVLAAARKVELHGPAAAATAGSSPAPPKVSVEPMVAVPELPAPVEPVAVPVEGVRQRSILPWLLLAAVILGGVIGLIILR